MSYPVLVALAALGIVTAASGIALLAVRKATTSAVLLLLAGAACVSGTVLEATGHRDPAMVAWTSAYALGLALAVAAYPVPQWRRPADFVALVVVAGCGALITAQSGDPGVLGTLGIVGAVTLLAHLWWRIERATLTDRTALVWMTLCLATAAVTSGFLVFLAPNDGGAVAIALLWSTVAPAMYVGAVRPEVVDVRGLVVQAVVLVTALIAYLALFMTLASLLQVLGDHTPPIGVLGVVGAIAAVSLHPLQVVLRGVVDALLFGVRPDPLGAAAQMADQIGEDPVQALRAIRAALVLPYAALEVDGEVVATSGARVTHTREVPLALGDDSTGRPVPGTLVVGLRPGDLTLGDDETVLRLVGPILAQALRARALAADLRASRGQVVDALEDERRRLRRDLHDGLGPRLSGIAFTADAARNSVRSDPALAEQLLLDLRADTTTAIADIRGLVYAMRPPALDELGLVGALRQQSASLRAPNGTPLTVEFRAASLPALSAAVEVAAYRIVVEALTNVARHSSSRTATVTLDPGAGGLRIEVLDPGGPDRRPPQRWAAGVGIAAMRERAAEVGGSLTARPTGAGGQVVAVLPMRSDAPRT